MNILAHKYNDSSEVVICQEPLHATQMQILKEKFFMNPAVYGFPFQMSYFLAVERQMRMAVVENLAKRVIVFERSLLSARHVYMSLQNNSIPKVHQEVYKTFFEEGEVGYAMPDEIIYLKPDVRKCLLELQKRNDENSRNMFTEEYLLECHKLYQEPSMKTDVGFEEVDNRAEDLTVTVDRIDEIIGKAKGVEIEILPKEPVRPQVVSIEGNVGAGKTSLIRSIQKRLASEDRKDIIILEEPVDEWTKVTDGCDNIMHSFYKHPNLHAFAFQTLIAFTTMRSMFEATYNHPDAKVILCERSLFSSAKVFAEALRDEGAMNEVEMEVYRQMVEEENIQWMNPMKLIYLETSPEICLERIQARGREEEGKIDIEWE